MRKTVSISAGCLVAAVLTHGMVSSGVNITTDQLPIFTYKGFFTHVIFGFWRLWTLAHGSTSTSFLHAEVNDLETFGKFLAIAVLLTFPLIGFGVAACSSRQRISWRWVGSLVIATMLAVWDAAITSSVYELRHITVRHIFIVAGLSEPLAESSRAVVVTLLMLWSAGVVRLRRSPGSEPIHEIVTA